MADVRLTATNPADSSVVPVACNEKGELKLEEIPDQSFDGNLQGDLTVSGSASFAGMISGNGAVGYQGSEVRVIGDYASINTATAGIHFTYDPAIRQSMITAGSDNSSAPSLAFSFPAGGQDPKAHQDITFSSGGSATFSGYVTSSRAAGGGIPAAVCALNSSAGAYPSAGTTYGIVAQETPGGGCFLGANGAVIFAGNKAGFTSQGHLWCTTPRGDTVMLTATVGGSGMWEEYNPSTRRDQIKEQWAEKNGIRPMPEESSQDEPETTQ